MSDPDPDPPVEVFLGDIESPNGSAPFYDSIEDIPDSPDLASEPEPEPQPSGATSIGDGTCVVCGAPTFRPPGLTKTGRQKRAPRLCDVHSRRNRIPEEGPQLVGLESQLRRIQEELADDLKLLGTLAGPLWPVTGFYIYDNSDPFTAALVKLCKNNKRALRILHRAAQVAPIYKVAEFAAGTAYSVQVDNKRADPHNAVAQRLGVDKAYDAIYSVSDSFSNTPSNSNSSNFTPPPRYATVQ